MCTSQIEEDRRKDSTYFSRRCRYDKKVEEHFIFWPSSQPRRLWINASVSCLCSPAGNIERAETNRRRLQWRAEDWTQHCKRPSDQSCRSQLLASSVLCLRPFLFVFESLHETPCFVTHFSPGSFLAAGDRLLQPDQVLWHGEVWVQRVRGVWALSEGLFEGRRLPHSHCLCHDVSSYFSRHTVCVCFFLFFFFSTFWMIRSRTQTKPSWTWSLRYQSCMTSQRYLLFLVLVLWLRSSLKRIFSPLTNWLLIWIESYCHPERATKSKSKEWVNTLNHYSSITWVSACFDSSSGHVVPPLQ